jgi:hypothetical protein
MLLWQKILIFDTDEGQTFYHLIWYKHDGVVYVDESWYVPLCYLSDESAYCSCYIPRYQPRRKTFSDIGTSCLSALQSQ